MSKDKEEILSIDSPIHQIRAVEEAVLDTGAAVLYAVGMEELADQFAGCSKEEIMEQLESMAMLPQLTMGGRPEGAPPVAALFIFIDQSLANLLDPVEVDKEEDDSQEE